MTARIPAAEPLGNPSAKRGKGRGAPFDVPKVLEPSRSVGSATPDLCSCAPSGGVGGGGGQYRGAGVAHLPAVNHPTSAAQAVHLPVWLAPGAEPSRGDDVAAALAGVPTRADSFGDLSSPEGSRRVWS